MLETCECARFLQEIRSPPIEGLFVALRSRSDAHGGDAFTEIVRIISLNSDARAEPDVFGLVCYAKASRSHTPQDAIALIEYVPSGKTTRMSKEALQSARFSSKPI